MRTCAGWLGSQRPRLRALRCAPRPSRVRLSQRSVIRAGGRRCSIHANLFGHRLRTESQPRLHLSPPPSPRSPRPSAGARTVLQGRRLRLGRNAGPTQAGTHPRCGRAAAPHRPCPVLASWPLPGLLCVDGGAARRRGSVASVGCRATDHVAASPGIECVLAESSVGAGVQNHRSMKNGVFTFSPCRHRWGSVSLKRFSGTRETFLWDQCLPVLADCSLPKQVGAFG